MNQNNDRDKKVFAAIIVFAAITLLVLASVAVLAKKNSSDMAMTATTVPEPAAVLGSSSSATNTPAATPSAPVATSSAVSYKDGSYSATGHYISPDGNEAIKVSLTLSSDKVTAAKVVSQTDDQESNLYISQFISGYKQLVVGKKISNIKLSFVSGSSLTSGGFNDALQQIKNQARS